jgi:hypothetical protein
MDKIPYQEIDFLIPVHRFKINFSYTRQKGMRFVREFLLRLIHISPMKPWQIATYFGFSKIELNEAINNLVNNDELEFSDDGDVVLTPLSESYFSKSGDSPEMLAFFEEFISLSYELVGFNNIKKFIENKDKRLGLKLEVDNEIFANSGKEVKLVFQKNFLKYFQDKILLTRDIDRQGKQPHLYSMGSVIKTSAYTLRLSNEFRIDFDVRPIERSNFSELGDSSSMHDFITKKLSDLQKPDNTEQLFRAMDGETKKFFSTKTFFDMNKLLQTRVELLSEKNNLKPIPFVGATYLKHNWDLIIDQLIKLNKNHTNSNKGEIPDLIWIAPIDPFWGKSQKLGSCISDLIQSESTKGKKAQRLFNTNIYLPLLAEQSHNNFFHQIKYDYKDFWENNMSYLDKGYSNGNIEIILLPKSFVVVNYHFSIPNVLPVTLPIGFISTNINIINDVQKEIEKFISDNKLNYSNTQIKAGLFVK